MSLSGLRGVRPFGDGCGLAVAPGIEPLGEPGIGERQHGGGEQGGVDGPARPIASVPTGMPAGICTMESRLSCPESAFDSTGTPKTGSDVIAAVMPGRCAAPPAPAITTLKPASRAPLANETRRSGVRWAETMRAS